MRRTVRGIGAGRPDALAELYDRCAPSVYELCVRHTDSDAAAERIVVAVFVHVWQRPEPLLTKHADPRETLLDLATRWCVAARHLDAPNHRS